MRPGRLDRILYVAPPDRAARLEIFDVNFRRMAVHEAVDREQLADMVRSPPAMGLIASDWARG